MKNNFIFLIIIILFSGSVHAFAQWTSFLTNNRDTDYVNAVVPEGNAIWAATNGGIVKWDTLNKSFSLDTLYYDHNYGYSIFSAAIDWNGIKWFGGYQSIYSLKDTTWTIFNKENTPLLNKPLGTVQSISIDNINKRIIFALYWLSYSHQSIDIWSYTLLSYDGIKWEELISFTQSVGIMPLVVDTLNPWDIWARTGGNSLYYFKKEAQGYISNSIRFDNFNNPIENIAIDGYNRLWMTAGKTIYVWDRIGFSPTPFGPDVTGASYLQNIVIDRNQVKWFGSDGVLVRYDDKTWSDFPFQQLDKNDRITALAIDGRGDIWMGRGSTVGLGGYGLWRFTPPLKVNDNNSLPQAIKISGNYPNPFNPSTIISFALSSPGKTELSIYSASGQKVRTLVSGNQTAGSHSVVWDGHDDLEKPVSSGVYISRLTSGNQTVSARMLLLR
jgi:hypothetical protein